MGLSQAGAFKKITRSKVKLGSPPVREAWGDKGPLEWAALTNNYFAAIFLPEGSIPSATVVTWALTLDQQKVHPAETAVELVVAFPEKGKVFIGPKEWKRWSTMGGNLFKLQDWGWLAPICAFLLWSLKSIYGLIANYGVGILLLTLLIKVAFYPLTQRSMVKMKEMGEGMKKLKPQIDRIKAKYKKMSKDMTTRSKMNEEMMALYQREGINPLGGMSGCLPLLLQMPIFFALFTMLPEGHRAERGPLLRVDPGSIRPGPLLRDPPAHGRLHVHLHQDDQHNGHGGEPEDAPLLHARHVHVVLPLGPRRAHPLLAGQQSAHHGPAGPHQPAGSGPAGGCRQGAQVHPQGAVPAVLMADLFETIAAEATPPGRGAVRVVRISGREALPILKSMFRAKGPVPWDRPRCLCLGDVGLSGQPPLDRALAVYFVAPDSFTGEDVVEIQAHGAPGVVRGLLDLAAAAGARMALPGEFSYRAYLNGKVTVMEAEAVNALVAAETDGQAVGLGGGLRGGLERDLRQIQDGIMDVRAECEARIDFPEDVETPSLVPMREKVAGLAEELESLLEKSSSLRYLREGWRVALVGPVNSGKSSLFNALLRRERALVTPHPGTTRDVLEESLQVGGYPLILIDTAGVRDTEDPVESLGVARGLEVAGLADGALLVFDGHKGWGEEEEALLGQLPASPPGHPGQQGGPGARRPALRPNTGAPRHQRPHG